MKTISLLFLATLAMSTQVFALGAITQRPDCQIIASDPSDVNHPVTYQCNARVGGDNSGVAASKPVCPPKSK